VRVKICGITCEEDALAAIEAGADALGFNLWHGSKRCLSLDENALWMRRLPPFVSRVAVLVDEPLEEALRVARHGGIDCVQFHGHETSEYLRDFASSGHPFIAARRPASPADGASIAELPTPYVLIDSAVQGELGGTGMPCDLSLASEIVRALPEKHVILAGGLRPANVADAVRAVRPWAVDVASGVETSPGRKDSAILRDFFAALRETP
jgi:phosphoribosylanthranilate isomerase